MRESILLVQTHPATLALQDSNLSDFYNFILLDNADQALKLCNTNLQNVASVVLGSPIKDPIQTSQRLYASDKSLSIVILSPSNKVEPIRKSINFTPFLGGQTVCFSESNIEELIPRIRELVEKTIKYRITKEINDKLNAKLLTIGAKKTGSGPSKDFIERLFDSAPIGIVTVDSEGKILALNEASSKFFEISESQTIGMKITEIFQGLKLIPDRVEEVYRETPAGRLYFEMTITTIIGQDQSSGWLLLLVDVTQRKKYQMDLEGAVKVRDEFLSIASHELKTPITSLKLQLQMNDKNLKKDDPGSYLEKITKANESALTQVERLTKLIDDLLDVSNITRGKVRVNLKLVNISVILKQAIERLEEQAESAKCIIETNIAEDVHVQADAFRLEQVFTNLLTNCFKYASGKRISVFLYNHSESIEIKFVDQGMGIAKSKIDLIFDRFERAISHTNISGLGLGLYISKNIVEAHSGSITVESVIGEGSIFTISLPNKANLIV